jgi:hypothetical protein
VGGAPAARAALRRAEIRQARASSPDEEDAKRFIQWGYTGVGAHLGLLARARMRWHSGSTGLEARFRARIRCVQPLLAPFGGRRAASKLVAKPAVEDDRHPVPRIE